jgi:hypothetical protein
MFRKNVEWMKKMKRMDGRKEGELEEKKEGEREKGEKKGRSKGCRRASGGEPMSSILDHSGSCLCSWQRNNKAEKLYPWW